MLLFDDKLFLLLFAFYIQKVNILFVNSSCRTSWYTRISLYD